MLCRVLVRFVIGDSACDIPKEDRLDEYSCKPSPLVKPVLGTAIFAHSGDGSLTGSHAFAGPVGMDFKVNRWIKISRLGVFDSGADGLKRSLVVSLWDVRSRKRIVEAKFTPARPGELIGNFRYLDIPLVTIPKVRLGGPSCLNRLVLQRTCQCC